MRVGRDDCRQSRWGVIKPISGRKPLLAKPLSVKLWGAGDFNWRTIRDLKICLIEEIVNEMKSAADLLIETHSSINVYWHPSMHQWALIKHPGNAQAHFLKTQPPPTPTLCRNFFITFFAYYYLYSSNRIYLVCERARYGKRRLLFCSKNVCNTPI